MNLSALGFTSEHECYQNQDEFKDFTIGRVISEHRERYIVKTESTEYDCEIIGHMRYSADSRSDFPAVGDWVAVSEFDDDKGLIHAILPRKNVIERQAVGKYAEKQIIASNIDYAFVVQALNRDFNINRLERYLTLCHASQVSPIIVLSKTDLLEAEQLQDSISEVKSRISDVPILAISNEDKSGITQLSEYLQEGKTYCLLGSSGVGKSTLLNNLCGRELMDTLTISSGTERGRHATTHRELIVLEQGGVIIDNPGMREIGITDAGGLETTYDPIIKLAKACKYRDCTHQHESGCAVIAAVDSGEMDQKSYENFLKLEREKSHFESTIAERRKKDKKFGKMVKQIKKEKGFKKL